MSATPRGFTGIDIPALADVRNCIHCGFCLPSCPTYLATGSELESPRGRLHLIGAILEGRIEANERVLPHLDLCLQCRACETACPSNVPYGRIMEDARAAIVAQGVAKRPRTWTLRMALLRGVIARPRVLRTVLVPARVAARLGLHRLGRPLLRRFLPSRAASIETQLAALRRRPFRRSGLLAQPASPRVRVALLTGCVHGELTPGMHEATVRVLARLGCEVVAPPDQACCGALHAHAGDTEAARALARHNIEAFEEAGVDAAIVNAAGCGAAMKEYGRLLRNDDAWCDRAERFASTVRDVLEYIAGIDGFEHGLGRLDAGAALVTLQDSCHLAHAQGIREAPRRLLSAIPGLDLRELEAPDRCCGAAGLYSLVQPEMSQAVLEAKMDDVEGTGASVICTSNPGCTLQLAAGIVARGLEARAVHVVELLDESYRAGAR
ncbi:MAG: 4Fe-4S dicluster domain-containing protein [Dehalococcoidia bacterium]|nr:4Fe-4S dicluster domain-containing protein [Dehalococcoidia bacterium]